jgi:hypothetical protein
LVSVFLIRKILTYQNLTWLVIYCRLLGEKNRLVRREQELTVESKQLELADLADRYSELHIAVHRYTKAYTFWPTPSKCFLSD